MIDSLLVNDRGIGFVTGKRSPHGGATTRRRVVSASSRHPGDSPGVATHHEFQWQHNRHKKQKHYLEVVLISSVHHRVCRCSGTKVLQFHLFAVRI